MSEDCKDCGEKHETVEDLVTKLSRRSKVFIFAYFASLALLGYTSYQLLGLFGLMSVVAGYGIYFFHLNMKATLNNIEYLRNTIRTVEGNSSDKKSTGKSTKTHGQYL